MPSLDRPRCFYSRHIKSICNIPRHTNQYLILILIEYMQKNLSEKCTRCGVKLPIKFGVPFYEQEMLTGRTICRKCKDKELGF